jgi:hypothetical protein
LTFAQDKHLICNGVFKTYVTGIGELPPNFDPVSITFDEKKRSFESQLLTPTCGNGMEPIKICRCVFEKTTISCSGTSRVAIEPSNIWLFSFSLDRVSGRLWGGKQFSNSGKTDDISNNSIYDYTCKVASIKF